MNPVPRLLLLAALAVGAAPAAASAAPFATAPPTGEQIPCVPGTAGPMCHQWHGTVERVADGDSFDVDLDEPKGAKQRHGTVPIRLTGVQAMEMKVYRRTAREGDCWGVEATVAAEKLIKRGHWRVRLTAQDPGSRSGAAEGGRNRLRRSVAVKIGGEWVDVGSQLIQQGLALPFPGHTEDHWNGRYQTWAQEAALAGRNIWGAIHCQPAPPAQVRVWLNHDADSADGRNLNDEWIAVKNLDQVNPLPLGGWFVRDSDLRRKRHDDPSKDPGYTIPAGVTVPPGGLIKVHVGSGADTPTDLYWGLRAPAFENPGDKGDSVGDGAYLFDPSGNLRAWMMYPCRVACTDPLQGKVKLSVDHSSKVESFTVTNVSGEVVDLEGYLMHSEPRRYHFPPGTILQPGESLRVQIGPGERSGLSQFWSVPMPFFKNKGPDPATIETHDGIVIDCFSWGIGHC